MEVALKRLAAALLLAAAVTAFYWKLVFTTQFTWLQSPDLAYQVIPWLTFQASEVHHHRIPLWDPNMWGGQPLAGQMITGSLNPLNWLLFAAPLRNGWIRQSYLHWHFVLLHILAAWAAYKFARDLGCRRSTAIFGACVFSLSGWMGTTDWPVMLSGAICAPLVLMYTFRLFRGADPVRCGIFAGFFLGLSFLSGHHQIPFFTALTAAALWFWKTWKTWKTRGQTERSPVFRRFPARVLVGLILFAFFTLGAGALQILPAQQYGKLAVRWVGAPDPISWTEKVPYAVQRDLHFEPVSLLGLVLPGMWRNADPYLGSCAIIFVALAIALKWRRIEAKLLVLIALGALFYSWAGYSVFHGFLYAVVPLMEKARNASQAIFIAHLAMSMLAALGLEARLLNPDSIWSTRVRRAAVLFAGLVFLLFSARALINGYQWNVEDRPLAVAFAALLTAGVLKWRPKRAAILFLLLFLFEAGLDNSYHWSSTFQPNRLDLYAQYKSTSGIAQFILSRPNRPRIEYDDNEIPFNAGDLFGFAQSKAYVASLTSNVYKHDTGSPMMQNILGVEYAVRKQSTSQFSEEVFSDPSGLKVFRNPGAFPRAWTVHEALRIPNRDYIAIWLKDPAHDWRQSTFLLTDPPPLVPCPTSDQVEITSYTPNEVRLTAHMSCEGMIILADTNYPGWQAELDGRPVPIHEAYAMLRGVVSPPGDHRLIFRFRPMPVFLGAALSLLTCLVTAALALKGTA